MEWVIVLGLVVLLFIAKAAKSIGKLICLLAAILLAYGWIVGWFRF